ncbi:MAG: cyclic nucleotide-binding domain-containing protein [Candidatus Cloacimonadota bacterium]|nr:cyclic nucleotide-binding domain-containing protein [Candidatus Cloacimonadota bacterium]
MKYFKNPFTKKKVRKSSEKDDLIQFLAKVSLFENLSKNDRRNLYDFIHTRKYKSQETVFKKGYPNIVMYIVKDGELNTYLDDSLKVSVKTLKPMDYFGEVGVFIDETRTATIVAEKNSTLLAISKRDMKNFMNEFPKAGSKILYKLGKILSHHLIIANRKLVERDTEMKELETKLLSKMEE